MDLLIIQYKGTGASLNDLIGGQVAMSFGSLAGLVPYAKSGRLRALAVSSLKRAASLPDVPTVAETYPGFEVSTWYGLLAPAHTPRDIITRVQQDTVKVLALPDVRTRLATLGFDLGGTTPAEFAALLRSDLARWQKVIREGGIKAE